MKDPHPHIRYLSMSCWLTLSITPTYSFALRGCIMVWFTAVRNDAQSLPCLWQKEDQSKIKIS